MLVLERYNGVYRALDWGEYVGWVVDGLKLKDEINGKNVYILEN
jgi:hypothetical protein